VADEGVAEGVDEGTAGLDGAELDGTSGLQFDGVELGVGPELCLPECDG